MTTTTLDLTIDTTALDAAWRQYIDTHGVTWSGGNIWQPGAPNTTADKMATTVYALHVIAQQARSGVLPTFRSYQEAGAHFWTLVHNRGIEMNLTHESRWRRDYSTDTVACENIGQWLAENRTLIETLPVRVVPQAHDFVTGDLAVLDGRFVRIITSYLDTRTADVFWYASENGAGSIYTSERGVPWSRMTWAEPGVQRVRRKADIYSGYAGQGAEANGEYVLDRVYSSQDRAIWVRLPNGGTAYMCQNDFEPVGMFTALPERGVAYAQQDAWFLDTGILGYVEDSNRQRAGHERPTIGVHIYSGTRSSWDLESHPTANLYPAQDGDECVITETNPTIPVGTRVEYVRATTRSGSREIIVRWAGDEYTVMRSCVRFGHTRPQEDRTPENLTITVGGIEYVRKDVVDDDLQKMVGTMHQGAVDNGLCPVYDRTQRNADAQTTYLKMGSRYKNYDVVVEQTVTIRRTIRVTDQATEASARDYAIGRARDYSVRTVEPRLGEGVETIRVRESSTPTVITTSPVS
jgi:hypothetical protein